MLDPTWAADHQDVVDFLENHEYDSNDEFLTSVAGWLNRHGTLTPAQVDGVRATIAFIDDLTASEIEFRATAQPVPIGNDITVTGEVVAVHHRKNKFAPGQVQHRMLVQDDRHWRVWVAIPAALLREIGGVIHPDKTAAANWLRGRRVTLVVNIVPDKEGDPHVGQGKYPRAAVLLPVEPTHE